MAGGKYGGGYMIDANTSEESGDEHSQDLKITGTECPGK